MQAPSQGMLHKTTSMETQMNEEDIFGVSTPSNIQIKELSELCSDALRLQKEIDQGEEMVKQLKNELHVLNTKVIPDLMLSLGVKSQTLIDGSSVEIGKFMNGGLPKDDRRGRALKWLEDHDGADIIKQHINMRFGRESYKLVKKVLAALDRLEVEYESDKSVHPQTLYKYARERLENGEDIPLDLLGLFTGRVAKITRID